MQKMYKGLENKIISLQQRIDELNKEKNSLKQETAIIPELKGKLEGMRLLESTLKSMRIELQNEKTTLSTLSRQLETERDEKMTLVEQKDKLERDWTEQRQSWRTENDELKERCHEMIELAKKEDTSMLRGEIFRNIFV